MQENNEDNSLEVHCRKDMKLSRWEGLEVLGEGTFSKVILATSLISDEVSYSEGHLVEQHLKVLPIESSPEKKKCDKLVAVKICEYGTKDNNEPNNLTEISAKREIDILKDINHPSIVRLKAWNIEATRVILILDYCPGGDLLKVASEYRDVLILQLLRRIFAELVAAVEYLHARKIVHCDIKLENILVNLTYHELEYRHDWSKYPFSVVTLTDFGLSQRIDDNEKLTIRCGSDDYAAPEVIMGQPYDGRATDAWSLGVLLYALLESRLPFDPIPNISQNHRPCSRKSHLIARVEWCWVKYAKLKNQLKSDPDDTSRHSIESAMQITEGLLKRARDRWSLSQIAGTEWVKNAIQIEGGIKFRDEE
ncbi:Serine/threonine-protein kinase PRR1 [Erysiphe neolycopersici]|uniref:Serine/threonine-protein kinase PRR1 n=1 Tax=Erysiphe neolycopersici TaxID=212602 RepID=A0A420HIN0_9PEZI|nr:Serine/threonine-protein kinase PRR1 [Erysiphe neolycopersici]